MIVAMGIVTYLVRLAPFLIIRKFQVPRIVEEWITYLGEGILISLLLPYLLLEGKDFSISIGNVKIISAVLCAVIAVKTKSLILTIICGVSGVMILSEIVR